MQEETIGITVGTCKLKTISPDKSLLKIFNRYVKDLNKIFYKGAILFRLDVLRNIEDGIQPIISQTHISRCMNLVRKKTGTFRQRKDSQGNILSIDSSINRLQGTLKKYKNLFLKIPTPAFKFATAYKPLEYAITELITNIRVKISENYLQYQKAYLRERIRQHLQKYGFSELKRIQLGSLSHQVQQAINYDGILKEFSDKHLSKKDIVKMMKPLQILCTIIHNEIPEEIRYLSKDKMKWLTFSPDRSPENPRYRERFYCQHGRA
jgi:hypothetical protein